MSNSLAAFTSRMGLRFTNWVNTGGLSVEEYLEAKGNISGEFKLCF
jgi:hypothetical protein